MTALHLFVFAFAQGPSTDIALAGPEGAPPEAAPTPAPEASPAPAPTPAPEASPAPPAAPVPGLDELPPQPPEELDLEPAWRPEVQVAVEVGSTGVEDPRWRAFTPSTLVPYFGVRGAVKVAQVGRIGFSPGLSWRHATASTGWLANRQRFGTYLATHTASIGLTVDYAVATWFEPYVRVDGELGVARMRVDPDVARDGDPQSVRTGVAPGLAGALGVAFRIPVRRGPDVAFHLDAGYGWSSAARWGEDDALSLRGVQVRSGVGLRF